MNRDTANKPVNFVDKCIDSLLCFSCVVAILCLITIVGGFTLAYITQPPQKKSVLSPTPPTKAPTHAEAWTNATPNTPSLFAVLVTTNLVSQPCPCGFCNPARGLRVPEHINQIGYDLRIEISTNYLPIIFLPKKGEREEEGGLYVGGCP